jgi:hypothetical protein
MTDHEREREIERERQHGYMQDGHKYEAPESEEDRRSKGYDYAVLGILVVIILLLIATGIVPIFSF